MPLIKFIKKQLYVITVPVMIPVILLSIHILVSAKETDKDTLAKDAQQSREIITLYDYDIASDFLMTVNGTASYYGKRFHNRRTASGEIYDMNEYSAAHKKLPFGTILKVTNKLNGKSTFVRINDRGPYVRNRIIDLSYKSAKAIDGLGLPKITIEGFIPGKVNIPEDGKHYFAYSLYDSPICIPADKVEIMSHFTTFHDAVTEYKELLKEGSDSSDLFIFVDATEYSMPHSAVDNDSYFIGKTAKPKRIPLMTAERIYP
jgi:rare lipoprotein A